MFLKLIIFLTCMSTIICVEELYEPEDEAVLQVFNEALILFNRTFGLTKKQFEYLVGDDNDSQLAVYKYFYEHERALPLKDNINKRLFHDLVSEICRDCHVPLVHLVEHMMFQIRDLKLLKETTNVNKTFERSESTASNQPTEPSASNQSTESSASNQSTELSSSNQPFK
ncbi:uncharacterized protein LOC126837017 [Adelges cooleyi]|uniref:uncharacterized protein LOC126837017 n=1 Tax=Adelges cooleyi TaxID=133065 RepID=UPI0021805B02|nr:uncharacterized protein LOC126837017 [Adelges cooleyi]